MSSLAYRTRQCYQSSCSAIKTRTPGPFLGLFYRSKHTMLPTRRQTAVSVAVLGGSSELTRSEVHATTGRRARKMARGAAAVRGAAKQLQQSNKTTLLASTLEDTPANDISKYESQPLADLLHRGHVVLTVQPLRRKPPRRPRSYWRVGGCVPCLENCHSP